VSHFPTIAGNYSLLACMRERRRNMARPALRVLTCLRRVVQGSQEVPTRKVTSGVISVTTATVWYTPIALARRSCEAVDPCVRLSDLFHNPLASTKTPVVRTEYTVDSFVGTLQSNANALLYHQDQNELDKRRNDFLEAAPCRIGPCNDTDHR
jgi:hypothetical protein